MKLLVVAAMLTVVATTANASVEGKFRLLGAGAMSCGQYVKADTFRKGNVDSWMNGFFTSINLYTPGEMDISGNTDVDSRQLWLDNWCKAHPLENVGAGAQALYMEFRDQKPKK